MHSSSFNEMRFLLERTLPRLGNGALVLDVGSRVADSTNRSYRTIVEALSLKYLGLDMVDGLNVDIVPVDPYVFPVESESIDVVISGQVLEHIEYPWLTMQEVARVLKPNGYAIIIAPSSGPEHKFPTDCYRYYPDGMKALGKWCKLNTVLCLTNWNETELFMWGDTVAVFKKGESCENEKSNWEKTSVDIDKVRYNRFLLPLLIKVTKLLVGLLTPFRSR